MAYLEEVQKQINYRDFSKFLQIWEEYCTSDHVEPKEFISILRTIENSDFAKQFGKIVDTALPLWETIKEPEQSYQVLKALIDLQTINTPILAEITQKVLQERYGKEPQFGEWSRLVGLRTKENFQRAISNFELLAHLKKGNFVLHSAGWGAGEVIDIAPLRQQVTIEFEKVLGNKQITFEHAFKVLTPLPLEHFLSRRFGDPDGLEKEARENPVDVIKLLLRDLGPKTATEIKDELSELVIPEKEWSKWWQGARAKLKKDTMVQSPSSLKDPFVLREKELSHADRLNQQIQHKQEISHLIQTTYSFLRDMPDIRNNPEVRASLRDKLLAQMNDPNLTIDEELQLSLCLETQFNHTVPGKEPKSLIQKLENVEEVIQEIEIIAFKKRALGLLKETRSDWPKIFLNLLFAIKHSAIREYILKELNQGENKKFLENEFNKLVYHPELQPDFCVWYFQKILDGEDSSLPFGTKEGQSAWFEVFLVLLHRIEAKPEFKDLVKKMYIMVSGKRYELVRTLMQGASLAYVKEFLLLASKCHTFTDHDKKILQSLAAVVHPSLAKEKESSEKNNADLFWTTEQSYLNMQERVKHIGTVEIVENAREIEAARALGDLRENSEYKFALEKRSRLQGQLKTLSDQLKKARIITPLDIQTDEVGIGNVVELVDSTGKKVSYTILGAWEADPDKNILSIQSKLAASMLGCRKGDTFKFKEESLTVANIKSYLDK